MKVSLQWLKEWVSLNWDVKQAARQLTMAGLEVDGLIAAAGQFNQVIVAQVVETAPHPDADKLTLCKVNTGSEQVDIVCGATNVIKGLKVALAQVGAKLPNGMKIKPAKLRGQPSQGMLCSAVELGMAEQSEGIMELEDNAPVGEDIRQYLNLDDVILDIDLTPNRADCFSIRGIAREASALAGSALLPLPELKAPTDCVNETINLHLNAEAACPRFCGRVIKEVNVAAKTPLWMQERLRRCGLRSINPIVDVTNYVMVELGQPLHAYDLNALQGDVRARFAKEGETIQLLDEKTMTLHDDALVIADDNGPLSLAGVMGGLACSVSQHSQSVFLESAYFEPKHIAGIARRYGLCTDSSQRFERGVDPALQQYAINYATQLIVQICGGQAGEGVIAELDAHLPTTQKIAFDPAKVGKLTGVHLSDEVIESMLKALGMKVDSHSLPWQVTQPSWRFDINYDVDLVEEVIRLHGYEAIEGDAMSGTVIKGNIDATEQLNASLASALVMRGYRETITYSFVDPQVQAAFYPHQEALTLLNPLSTEISQMRLGLWPGLIASMLHNVHRQHNSMSLFESGVTFCKEDGKIVERAMLAGLALGHMGSSNWCDDKPKIDFYTVKGDVEAVLANMAIEDLHWQQHSHDSLHPGQSAEIFCGDRLIGRLGQLHPSIGAALELSQTVFLFELCLSSLRQCQLKKTYQGVSKYPLIRRDLALLVDDCVSFAEVKSCVQQAVGTQLLRCVGVFDLYQGASIPANKKSLAINVTLQADDKTLTDDEINSKISAILTLLKQQLSAELRE